MSRAGKRGGSGTQNSKASQRSTEERSKRVLKKFDKIYERTKDKPTRLGELFRLHKAHQTNRAPREGSDGQD